MTVINDEFKKNVGKRLRKLREHHAFTINKVVEKLSNDYYSDIDEKSIRRYEKGEFLPKVDNLMNLAELYGTTLDYIIYGKETSDDNSFTWYDNFKRLNRLLYTMDLKAHTDDQGKVFLEFSDDEAEVYWHRIEHYNREKESNNKINGTFKEVTINELDDLFADYANKTEQLTPIEVRKNNALLKAMQTEWVASLTVEQTNEKEKQFCFTFKATDKESN